MSSRVWMRSRVTLALVGAVSLGAPLRLTAQQPDTTRKTVAPDNTKQNQDHNTTAQNQGGTKSDLTITRALRRAVIKDTALSMYAHNVKIITMGGQVTLKGPVRSEEEKSSIETLARGTAGVVGVVNRLTIKPPQI